MITYEKARDWCISAHGEQKYGKCLPYSFHLDAAAEVALRFHITNVFILLAILGHDVVEDTSKTLRQMWRAGFPLRSLLMIFLVTDRAGATRAEKKARTLPWIGWHRGATIVKLCDRIANVEHSIRTADPKYNRHVQEYAFFRACLYNPTHLRAKPMWEHLDALLGWSGAAAPADSSALAF